MLQPGINQDSSRKLPGANASAFAKEGFGTGRWARWFEFDMMESYEIQSSHDDSPSRHPGPYGGLAY